MAFSGTVRANASQDVDVLDLPTDSISSIQFSPVADFLAVGSWDNSVRVYEIGADGQSQGKVMLQHTEPVLSVCWNKGTHVFSGGADGAGRMLDVETGQAMQVAQHDATIRVVKWVDAPGSGVLATGSWDKTIKYWDLRQSNPVATVNLPERCYSLDIQFPLMVVGTADRTIQIYDVNNLGTIYKSMRSPLKMQTRVIACLPGSSPPCYAIGGVEGRVVIHHVDTKSPYDKKYLNLRCHRRSSAPDSTTQNVYSVNDLSFHPVHRTLSTAGSDGSVWFWDTDEGKCLTTFDLKYPITTTAFNCNGSIFAYAISYDWHKGHIGMVPGHPNRLMLHACTEDEVKR